MNKKLLQQTLGCLKIAKEDADSHFIVSKQDSEIFGYVIADLEKELAKPEQSNYSDIVSDGGLDPRNKFDAQPEQEPVCDKDPSLCGFVQCQLGKACKNTPINTMPTKIFAPNLEQILNAAGFYRREWVGLTEHEIWECQKPGLSDDVYKLIEAKLKELNT